MIGDEPQSFLLLNVGKHAFALQALLVRRVMDAEVTVPVPRAPAFVQGAANVAGRVVCIIDFARLLGFPDQSTKAGYWVIVDLPDGQLGLGVWRVRQSAPGANVVRLDDGNRDGPMDQVIDGIFTIDGEVFRVLSLRALYDYVMTRMT
ncbi:MAG: chemotaxis protein CheW [Deltaproteobacteria bacterium]|nr:chemotaxis protein CheW [Deltaproteobacteria bacterium]